MKRTAHLEARADFHQLDLLLVGIGKDMVAETDKVVTIGECHCSCAVRARHGVKEFEDVLDTLA